MPPPFDRLWAPWRLEYIKIMKEQGCFFCTYIKEKKDAKNLVVRRGKKAICVVNKYPYNNGHLMVAPIRHTEDFDTLEPEETLEIWSMVAEMKKRIDHAMRPQGYNIGVNLGRIAGAGLPEHLHVHIVPRWGGDTNFMPVIGQTKVMPMSLKETYRLLTSKGKPSVFKKRKKA
jgi:ATP adenylyltransferase